VLAGTGVTLQRSLLLAVLQNKTKQNKNIQQL
jgi:hypothetical protein